MAEKRIASIEVKFYFHIGEEPDDDASARYICVETRNGEKRIYEAEWLGDLWEVPCHYDKELWPGEKVLGWAEKPKIKISYSL